MSQSRIRMHQAAAPSLSSPWGLLACLLVLAGLSACDEPDAKAAKKAPAEVGVVVVQPQRHVVRIELPGRTRARSVAEIRPQVGGIVQQRLFEEGSQVKAEGFGTAKVTAVCARTTRCW